MKRSVKQHMEKVFSDEQQVCPSISKAENCSNAGPDQQHRGSSVL